MAESCIDSGRRPKARKKLACQLGDAFDTRLRLYLLLSSNGAFRLCYIARQTFDPSTIPGQTAVSDCEFPCQASETTLQLCDVHLAKLPANPDDRQYGKGIRAFAPAHEVDGAPHSRGGAQASAQSRGSIGGGANWRPRGWGQSGARQRRWPGSQVVANRLG